MTKTCISIFLYFCTVIDTFIYPYYYYYIMKGNNEGDRKMEEEAEIVSKSAQIRADTQVMLTLGIVEASGLKARENVIVSTKRDSGKIVIERMKKGGN